jgi:hypothetical protein
VRLLVVAVLAILTVGCSTHQAYYAAIAEANASSAAAAQARYAALGQLAAEGDETTRMAATMALAMSQGPMIVRPEQTRPVWLEVLSITAGPLAMLGTTAINAGVSQKQISANRDVAISANESFVGLGVAGINAAGAAGAAGADATARTAQAGLATIREIVRPEPIPMPEGGVE